MNPWHPTEQPFPHVIVDGYWDDDLLHAVTAEFPAPADPRWKRYSNGNERKFEGPPPMWGSRTRELFDQIDKVIGQINDISDASAVEEQSATTNEIARNANEAAKGSTEISKNIANISQAPQRTRPRVQTTP